MLIDDFHNDQAVPLVPVARAGMSTLPYVEDNSWVITGKRPVSTDPPSATLAAHPWARRPERWANSRSTALVCFEGAGPWRKPHDDREASRSHPGSDDRPIRAPGPGLDPERRGANHREHRRGSHPLAWLTIIACNAPPPCPDGARPAFLTPSIDSAIFHTSEHYAPGSAKPAGIGLGQPGPMFVCGGPRRQSSCT